jgi:hypothetical protein
MEEILSQLQKVFGIMPEFAVEFEDGQFADADEEAWDGFEETRAG